MESWFVDFFQKWWLGIFCQELANSEPLCGSCAGVGGFLDLERCEES